MKTSLTVAVVCVAAILSIALLTPAAHAGFLSVSAAPVGAAKGHGPPSFVWDKLPPQAAAHAQGVLTEVFSDDLNGEYDVEFSGETDGDPILQITKDVTNSTSYAWIGYNINLDPLDTDTFVGVPTSGGTSGGMSLVSQTGYSLVWGTPNVVQPGQTVSFTFQVNVPDNGTFGFTLSQSPVSVPEPASIALAGLALLLFGAVARKPVV